MNPTEIAAIAALIAQIGPLGLQLWTMLEARLNLGTDTKANIANAIAASDQADDATIAAATAWMAKNGFKAKVTFVPTLAANAGMAPVSKV